MQIAWAYVHLEAQTATHTDTVFVGVAFKKKSTKINFHLRKRKCEHEICQCQQFCIKLILYKLTHLNSRSIEMPKNSPCSRTMLKIADWPEFHQTKLLRWFLLVGNFRKIDWPKWISINNKIDIAKIHQLEICMNRDVIDWAIV